MDLQLRGKTALVSGSTAGIGFAIARLLANEGAGVIINGRTQKGVDKAVAITSLAAAKAAKSQGRPPPAVLGFAGDLSQADAAEALIKKHRNIDILINNLGIFEPKPFEQIPDADWRRFFEVNVLSGVRLARLALPRMRKKNWGRIIFISSESGVQIPAEMVHYGVTKTAQIAVARGLAETLTGTGITVNSILPGPTRSRGVNDFVDDLAKSQGKTLEEIERDFFKEMRPSSIIKRFATPEEVANLVVFAASQLSSAITGAALRVDGGVIRAIV